MGERGREGESESTHTQLKWQGYKGMRSQGWEAQELELVRVGAG